MKIRMNKALVGLTEQELITMRVALAHSYLETKRRAKRQKWRPAETAMALADIEMLYEKIKKMSK